jgi:hypothetical protein
MDKQKITLLFIIGCIGARMLLVILAKRINLVYLQYMGYIAIIVVIAFMYSYYKFNKNKEELTIFKNKVWWNKLRPIHAVLYAIFAYLAINKSSNAWIPLFIDVIIGLAAFVYHYNGIN